MNLTGTSIAIVHRDDDPATAVPSTFVTTSPLIWHRRGERFGLSHGVLPDGPVENEQRLVRRVHRRFLMTRTIFLTLP
jgi:hypothetical protein